MSGGLELDTGAGKAKFIVLGAIALAFGVVGYLVAGHGAKAQAAPKVVATVAAAPTATPASAPTSVAAPDPLAADAGSSAQRADTSAADAGLAATETTAAPAAMTATSEPASDVAPSPAPSSQAAVSDVDADQLFAAGADTPAAAREVSSAAAPHSTPRLAVRAPAPPALDALHAWWADASTHDFNVQYVGQAAGTDALVFRFSKNIADSAAAAQHISVMSDSGAAVGGTWKAGSNPYVLVYEGVAPGRYLVRIDPQLASAGGKRLGEPLQGAVYVQ
ncbi:hypothetical protein [Solimonas terrae]|uniref:Uncharacterized protein n=1 Tax=Solimonas terrae TaxID=1396819 RepID=A0A6M2BP15_9GAMM|nr:hypothetical protein [Solimonas terrae]NGY04346.1 hypothetical protein [Solimonas terrae]